MYYVYAGSYTVEDNAINQAVNLFKAGYDVRCTKTKRFLRLQVGEFEKYENAVNFRDQLNKNGFPAFIEENVERKPMSWQLTYLTQN